jgi:hypothetical protein
MWLNRADDVAYRFEAVGAQLARFCRRVASLTAVAPHRSFAEGRWAAKDHTFVSAAKSVQSLIQKRGRG